jgi:hypothetical protein
VELVVSVLIGVAIGAGLAALEARDLRISTAAIAAGGVCTAAIAFLLGALEVGVGALIAAPILASVLVWALRRTDARDTVKRIPSAGQGVLVLVCLVVFIALLMAVAVPLLGKVPALAEHVEGLSYISMLREALVVLAAVAAVWALARAAGRRNG